jgi:DNA-binding response OmpR family regulator
MSVSESFRILLVEDEPVIQELVTTMLGGELSGRRVEVHVVADGDQALGVARRVQPDLVLLDVVLPGLDGVSLCRLIKADPVLRSRTTVLMLTARVSERDREAARRAGADGYLEKPFRGFELMERVEALIQAADAG